MEGLDNLETFQTIWKLSRQSENFPDNLEQIQAIGKLSRQSGKFIDNLEGQSGNLPDNMEK